MEVYKITCTVNNKVYIGSTRLTKEARWGNLGSSSSHLSCARDNNPRELYQDIRKYGESAFFLETLEVVDGDRHEAYLREDYWIKYYWSQLGPDMMYNQNDLACGRRDWSVPFDPESQLKATEARRAKYGSPNACCMTPEAQARARATRLAKYGRYVPTMTPESQASRVSKIANHYLDTKTNQELIGCKEVHEILLDEGYQIGFDTVKRMLKGIISNVNKSRYPELLDRFIMIRRNA